MKQSDDKSLIASQIWIGLNYAWNPVGVSTKDTVGRSSLPMQGEDNCFMESERRVCAFREPPLRSSWSID